MTIEPNSFPKYLNFKTKLYSYDIEYTNLHTLKFEAIEIKEPTRLYRGDMRGEDRKSQGKIQKIFNYFSDKRIEAIYKNNFTQLAGIISVIDASKQANKRQDYRLRILLYSQLIEISMKLCEVESNYFLKKELFFAELQRRNDSLIINGLQEKLQLQDRKIDEQVQLINKQTEEMKTAFKQNLGGLVQAVTGRINQQFEENAKKYKIQKDEDEQSSITKKLLKKLKKRIKKQKKSKRRSKKTKKKDKKKKKEKIKQLKRLIEADRKMRESAQNHRNGQENKNNNHYEAKQYPKTKDMDSEVISVPLNGENGIWTQCDAIRFKLEQRRKQNEMKHQQRKKQHELIKSNKPQPNGMSKLRGRGDQQLVNIEDDSNQIKMYSKRKDMKQKRIEKDKKQKKEKKDKKQKYRQDGNMMVEQNVELQNQIEYKRKLDELRKAGNIEAVRLGRINRIKAVIKAPVVLEYDEFNPEYNGDPKYKPFVKLNQFQTMRPGDIFTGRLNQPPSQTKKIPAIFRSDIPSFKSYQIDGSTLRKIKGTNYQQMVFDYPIPVTGKHITTMRILQSKRFYIWFGVIDFRQKDREQSFNKKNCIALSFKTGHIVTNNKWSKNKIGSMAVGLAIRMQIDMDKSTICWFISDGRSNVATISKLLKKLVLVPYFQIMDNEDQVQFDDA